MPRLRTTGAEDGRYNYAAGRGRDTRKFVVEKMARDNAEGATPGWRATEVGITFLTIRGNGWTLLDEGMTSKAAAVAVCRAEVEA